MRAPRHVYFFCGALQCLLHSDTSLLQYCWSLDLAAQSAAVTVHREQSVVPPPPPCCRCCCCWGGCCCFWVNMMSFFSVRDDRGEMRDRYCLHAAAAAFL